MVFNEVDKLIYSVDILIIATPTISHFELAKKALEAGCNLVLYCKGNVKDNFKLIKSLPYIDKFTSKKTSEFYKFLR